MKQHRAHILFFAGEKGGVGKTVVACTKTSHLSARKVPVVGIEADITQQDFAQWLKDEVPISFARFSENRAESDAADTVIEQALAHQTVVVNMPSNVHLQERFFWDETGFLEELSRYGISITIFFVCASDQSLPLLERSVGLYGIHAKHIVVKNLGLGQPFEFERFESDPAVQAYLTQHGIPVLSFPSLHPRILDYLREYSIPFSKAVTHKSLSIVNRSRVHRFLQTAYAAFDIVQ